MWIASVKQKKDFINTARPFWEQITLTFTPVTGLYRNQQTMLYASSFLQDLSPFPPPKEKKKEDCVDFVIF